MPLPQDPVAPKWLELESAFRGPGYQAAISLAVYLLVGGLLACYVRFLYRRTSRNAAADSVARVFPLLTLVTIAVITVVKSSLALSLGLVGALSIVRFRAAIKDPEELVYLFLCIGIGLSLGAEQPWLALVLVVVATVFVAVLDRLRPNAHDDEAYLTIVGPAARYFAHEDASALAAVKELCRDVTVLRCEIDGDEGQLRVHLHHASNDGAQALVGALRERLPGCQISFVDAGALL